MYHSSTENVLINHKINCFALMVHLIFSELSHLFYFISLFCCSISVVGWEYTVCLDSPKICLLKFEMHQLVLESGCDSLNQNWIDLRRLKIPSSPRPQSHNLICSFSCFHFHHKVLAVTHHLLSLWDAFFSLPLLRRLFNYIIDLSFLPWWKLSAEQAVLCCQGHSLKLAVLIGLL